MAQPLIESSALTMQQGGRTTLTAPPLAFPSGRIHGLIGASGSGKTTLLNCLGLLLKPTQGTVSVDGKDTSGWREARKLQFWRDRAAFVFQDYGLVPDWTVLQNVFLSDKKKAPTAALAEKLAETLRLVGLEGRQDALVSTLSGGEKQRVSIARAPIKDAAYLFADEPTASLDPENRATVIRLLRTAAERGASVVVATHDEEMISACDETTRLHTPPQP
ncbi:ATP-binding cassette domain-containing protein [Falsarthrobacter nasiphocae]|uniref:ABC transport system ATP-binding protein n=1 Tax=Falsarthrobacter nasiphocae TaxID=189863 RepID=A0AAE3YGR9_9MICC|nr:ATP-binding cassette domain-containing protein [Falsarthrobacter nasiphocae]MDR6892427.1 putative ABC transport system ATP-binding protein [Falsarthrobacter nasiphocae]